VPSSNFICFLPCLSLKSDRRVYLVHSGEQLIDQRYAAHRAGKQLISKLRAEILSEENPGADASKR
jgi:hypothetical protein